MQSSIFLCLSQARTNWEGCGRNSIRHKNRGIDAGGLLIGPDGVALTRIISLSASCYLSQHHKVQIQKNLSYGTSSPVWSRKRGCKTVVVWWWIYTVSLPWRIFTGKNCASTETFHTLLDPSERLRR